MPTSDESSKRLDGPATPPQPDSGPWKTIRVTEEALGQLALLGGASLEWGEVDPLGYSVPSLTLSQEAPSAKKVWEAARRYFRMLDRAEAQGPTAVSPEDLGGAFTVLRDAVEALDDVWDA